MSRSSYLARVEPSGPGERTRWYLFTAPGCASMFLWVGFYQPLGQATLNLAGFGVLLLGLLVAGVFGWGMYVVPATLGRQTGLPLAAVASSTFGSRGGWYVPGLLVVLLQTAWLGAALNLGARLFLRGITAEPGPANVFVTGVAIPLTAVACAVVLAGSRAVAWVAIAVSLVSVLALVFLVFEARDGLALHTVSDPASLPAALLLIHMVLAFAMAVTVSAPDFGRRALSARDVLLGGAAGIGAPVVYAGFLGLVVTAGGRVLDPLTAASGFVGAAGVAAGSLAPLVDLLLALTCIPAACVLLWLSSNGVGVVLPDTAVRVRTPAVGLIAVALAASGLVTDLVGLANLSAALLAPLAGAVTADFIRSGWKWAQTRPGWNYAGFGALLLGFIVGSLPRAYPGVQPAVLYSFATGFLAYLLLAQLGLLPRRTRVRRRKLP